jgi:hypothetical protein
MLLANETNFPFPDRLDPPTALGILRDPPLLDHVAHQRSGRAVGTQPPLRGWVHRQQHPGKEDQRCAARGVLPESPGRLLGCVLPSQLSFWRIGLPFLFHCVFVFFWWSLSLVVEVGFSQHCEVGYITNSTICQLFAQRDCILSFCLSYQRTRKR